MKWSEASRVSATGCAMEKVLGSELFGTQLDERWCAPFLRGRATAEALWSRGSERTRVGTVDAMSRHHPRGATSDAQIRNYGPNLATLMFVMKRSENRA